MFNIPSGINNSHLRNLLQLILLALVAVDYLPRCGAGTLSCCSHHDALVLEVEPILVSPFTHVLRASILAFRMAICVPPPLALHLSPLPRCKRDSI